MLLRVGDPSVGFLEELHRLRLDVREVVQRFDDLNTSDVTQINFVAEDAAKWIGLHWVGTELTANIVDLCHIRAVIEELQRVSNAFRREVSAIENVADFVLGGKVIERCDECVVLRNIDVRNARFEERELEVSHFLPVDHFCKKVEAQSIDEDFDIIRSDLRIPATINVEHEGTEAKLFNRDVEHVGAVGSTAHSHDAIKVTVPTIFLYLFDDAFEFFLPPFVGVPIRENVRLKAMAMVADPVIVETNLRVRCVHHAACATDGIFLGRGGRRKGGNRLCRSN